MDRTILTGVDGVPRRTAQALEITANRRWIAGCKEGRAKAELAEEERMIRKTFWMIASLGIAVVGCAGDDDGGGDVESAESASKAVESTGDVAYVNAYFAGAAELSTMATSDAAAEALAAVEAEIRADLEASAEACVTVTTDASTFIEVTFDGCTGAQGRITLDGSIRGEISFDTTSCGPFECPTAVVYDVSTDGLTIGETTIAGEWTVHDSLALGVATTWDGELTISRGGASITSSSSAEWTVEGDCVTYSLDAEVDLGARSLGITADDVTRCMGECPTTGSVNVSTAAGASLSWTYDGGGQATVQVGAGAEIEVTLACAE
jgi:hypothetical protein